MKATHIRTVKGEIPSSETVLKLERLLLKKIKSIGFISNVTILTRSAVKIGLHMCSFRIDPAVHGHNEDYGYCGSRTKKGFKRTCIPTWGQREDFNHLVNDCFDELSLSARIMSGPFKVRDLKEGRVNEWSPSVTPYSDRLFEIRVGQ